MLHCGNCGTLLNDYAVCVPCSIKNSIEKASRNIVSASYNDNGAYLGQQLGRNVSTEEIMSRTLPAGASNVWAWIAPMFLLSLVAGWVYSWISYLF
jgi:hypothetical protein